MKRLILAAVLLLLFSSPSFARTNYYVCSTGGNDSNDGLTSSTPWASLTNVNSGTYATWYGGQFNFCGGGTWTGIIQPPNDGEQYGVYNALPAFTGTASVSGDTLTVLTQTGTASIGLGSKVTMAGLPTSHFGKALPVYIIGLVSGTGGVGTYKINLNLPDNKTLNIAEEAVSISGAPPKITGSGSTYAVLVNSRNDTKIDGLVFENTNYTVAAFQSSFQSLSGVSLTNSGFFLHGSNASGAKGLYFLPGGGYDIKNLVLSDSILIGNGYLYGGSGQGIHIYHGANTVHDWLVSNNVFYNWGEIPFYILGSSQSVVTTAGSYPYGINISGNTFVNNAGPGATYTSSGMISTDPTGLLAQSYIQDNVFYNTGTPSTPNTNVLQMQYNKGVIVQRNDIQRVYTSIPDGCGIEVDWAWADENYLSDGVIVRQNYCSGINALNASCVQTFAGKNTKVSYNLSDGNSTGFSNYLAHSTGNVFYNNTSVNSTQSDVRLDDGGTGQPSPATEWYGNIFASNGVEEHIIAVNGSTNPTEKNNLFFGTTTKGHIWNTQTSSSVATDATDVLSDPLFVSATNYGIQRGSPARKAGKRIDNYNDLQTDVAGAVSNAAIPDIGAFIYAH